MTRAIRSTMSTHPSSLRLLLGLTTSKTVNYPGQEVVGSGEVPCLINSIGYIDPATVEAGIDQLPRSVESATKRIMDIVGALGGLIFLMPVMAVVALLIKLESRGPV